MPERGFLSFKRRARHQSWWSSSRRMTYLPNIKLIGSDVVEFWCLLLLDRILQRTNRFAAGDLDRKSVVNVGSKNRTVERHNASHEGLGFCQRGKRTLQKLWPTLWSRQSRHVTRESSRVGNCLRRSRSGLSAGTCACFDHLPGVLGSGISPKGLAGSVVLSASPHLSRNCA